MRSIPILFTPLPNHAPLKHKLKPTVQPIQPKADTKLLPPALAADKPAKVEMAIDHLPPSLQKLHDENSAFAHALKVDLAGITKAAYEQDSDSDSDDDEYGSEGLRFKRYMDKMRGIELGKEAYRFAPDEDEDEDNQDGAGQDFEYLPTIWKEDGEIKYAPPNHEVGEDAIGDVSAAYRVKIKGKSPVSLKDEDEPVLADQKINWSINWEKDFVFTFKFDPDSPVDTPELSTGDLSGSLADSPPLHTPHGSPCISRSKTMYNIREVETEDEVDEGEATQGPVDTPICPPINGVIRPCGFHFCPFVGVTFGPCITDTESLNLAINHIAHTYTDLMDSYAANCDDVRCELPARQRFKWENRVRPASLPTESGVQILRNGQPIYPAKESGVTRNAERVVNSILKQSNTDMVKVNRPSVRFNPDLEYSATPPPIEAFGRYRPATYRGPHAKYYQAAMRTTPVVPEPIGAPLINIMIDTLTPVACNIAKHVQIDFKATVKNISDAIDRWVPHHPGIERAGRGVDGRRLARIHKGLAFKRQEKGICLEIKTSRVRE